MKTIGLLLLIVSLLSSNFCQAQKKQKSQQTQYMAHYNSEGLKADWRKWQEMELEVKEYEDSLQQALEVATEKFYLDLQAFQQKMKNMSPCQAFVEKHYKKFQEQEQQLFQQEAAIDSQILAQRQPLEEKLLEKLNNSLQRIAENGNYSYILDATTIKMYINSSKDVTALLREELGD